MYSVHTCILYYMSSLVGLKSGSVSELKSESERGLKSVCDRGLKSGSIRELSLYLQLYLQT